MALQKPTVWKDDPHSSTSTERSVSGNLPISTNHIQLDSADRSNHTTSRARSPRVLSEKTTVKESATINEDGSIVVPRPDDCLNGLGLETAETNSRVLANRNTQPDEVKSESRLIASSLEHSQTQEMDGPNVSMTLRENDKPSVYIRFNSDSQQIEHAEEQTERSSSSIPALVSRTPSWTGTKALPALGRIRRGSFCDVKTFTSGKVLDLLSSCNVPTPEREKKYTKQFLEVENENLKYCRYLRSPETTIVEGDESLKIPLKYRPSKNIIIGHTKVHPLL